MKHALRKYLNNRGSALFMVLSLMTALMILVMAMYFSVVASRDVQYKVFYQEQSYRSAISISDAIISGLNSGDWNDNGSNTLKAAITGLNEGETISTNGNNFATFLGTGNADDGQLGAYTVSISRLANEDNKQVYDMAITVSVGGVVDTTHTFFTISINEYEEPQGPTQTFTSTGYSPNDVYIEGGHYYTTMFFDNEYTIIGGYRDKPYIYSNLNCGGSLRVNKFTTIGPKTSSDAPLVWAIRNNMYCDAVNGNIILGTGATNTTRGLLMVGGNLYLNNPAVPKNCDIYVLGNLYNASGRSLNQGNRVFVNGNIYTNGYGLPADTYCNGSVDSGSASAWGGDDEANNIMSVTSMAQKLDQCTTSQIFYKWEINDTDPSKPDYIMELDTRSSGGTSAPADYFTVAFNNTDSVYSADTDNDGVDEEIPIYTSTVVIPWEPRVATGYYGDGDLTYSAHVIKDVIDGTGNRNDGSCVNNYTVIIDTGDNPQNQHFIKLEPNANFIDNPDDDDDTNNDNGPETFRWLPGIDSSGATGDGGVGDKKINILIRGRGSVVVIVPHGVTYQSVKGEWTMHESWFYLLGGTVQTNSQGREYYVRPGQFIFPSDCIQYFHAVCDEGCTKCTYTTVVETGGCKMKDSDGNECGGDLVNVTCAEHEYTYTFCKSCGIEPEKDASGKYFGLCVNRVDRTAVRSKVNSMSGEEKSRMSGPKTVVDASGNTVTSTDIIYPTVNYFIVSCDESADIRMSGAIDYLGNLTAVERNSFWGFIYAPYMTYKSYSNADNGAPVRFTGGMIVSDYVISDLYSTMNVMPEFLPSDLISSENKKEKLVSSTGNSWKIELSHY